MVGSWRAGTLHKAALAVALCGPECPVVCASCLQRAASTSTLAWQGATCCKRASSAWWRTPTGWSPTSLTWRGAKSDHAELQPAMCCIEAAVFCLPPWLATTRFTHRLLLDHSKDSLCLRCAFVSLHLVKCLHRPKDCEPQLYRISGVCTTERRRESPKVHGPRWRRAIAAAGLNRTCSRRCTTTHQRAELS